MLYCGMYRLGELRGARVGQVQCAATSASSKTPLSTRGRGKQALFPANPRSDCAWMSWSGTPDSLHAFCEPKRATTPHIQEFWNTVSSVVYILVGGVGLVVATRNRSNWRIGLAWCALVIVGVGSGFFHATLRYPAELLDEVSMWILVLSFLIGKEDCVWWVCGPAGRLRFRVSLLALLIAATLLYVTFLVYEIFVYTFFVAVVAEIVMDLASRPRTWQTRACFCVAVAAIGVGYAVWQIEKQLCASHPHIWPLHVLWHLLSCVGGAFAILHNVFLRREKLTDNADKACDPDHTRL